MSGYGAGLCCKPLYWQPSAHRPAVHRLAKFTLPRYGPGVTQEVGADMAALNAKNVGVFTDSTLVK